MKRLGALALSEICSLTMAATVQAVELNDKVSLELLLAGQCVPFAFDFVYHARVVPPWLGDDVDGPRNRI